MKRQLLVRVGRGPFVIGLLVGAVALGWSVVRSYRGAVLRPSGVIAVPAGRLRDGPVGVPYAHKGWLMMRAFEDRMDSLRKDSVGARVYDSIVRVRPGLMDSVRGAEEYYYLQDHLKK